VDLVLPTSRDIVHAVLRKRGFEPAASDAGVVAEKLIRQLGGLPLVGYLSSHELLELLNRAAITTAVVEDDTTSLVGCTFRSSNTRKSCECSGDSSATTAIGNGPISGS
jgi:hypothetical protein